MRRAARVDANHGEIVKAFRTMGASVADTSGAGCGFPDLVVGFRGINLLVEVKDGNKTESQRRLTEAQSKFKEKWIGQYCVVTSIEDVINLLNKTEWERMNSGS